MSVASSTRFYLGTHEVSWLGRTAAPLFVSHRRLRARRRLPRALGAWALDSGGFTELALNGRWETSPTTYVAAVSARQPFSAEPLNFLCGCLERAIEAFGLQLQNRKTKSATT